MSTLSKQNESAEKVRSERTPGERGSAAKGSTAKLETTSPGEGLGPENPLSEREMEVASLLVTGATNAEIAQSLIISPHTVKVHLRNIFEKLQVTSRMEASMLLLQRGWLTVPGVEMTPAPAPAFVPPPVAPVEEGTTTTAENGTTATVTPSPGTAEPLPSPIPEPAALPPLTVHRSLWQHLYLIVALLLGVAAIWVPSLSHQASASPTLLSDQGKSVFTPAIIQRQARWEVHTPLPQARSRLALVTYNNRLFAIGGEANDGTMLARVDAYDLQLNKWRTETALPIGLSNMASAVSDGSIYVAGGTTQQNGPGDPVISNDLWRFSAEQAQWTRLVSLPFPLAGAALATYEEENRHDLYLIGGWDGQKMHDEIWRLSLPVTATQSATAVLSDVVAATPPTSPFQESVGVPTEQSAWSLVTRMPKASVFLGATTVQADLYVAGGFDGRSSLNQAARYSLQRGDWQSLPPLARPRSGLQLIYDGFDLYAIGGDETNAQPTHERFNLSEKASEQFWSNFASPVQGQWQNAAATSANGRIYVMGGWGGVYLDIHLEYQSSFRNMLPIITNP